MRVGGGRERSLIRRVVLGIVTAELVCMTALTAISIEHERRVRLHAVDVTLEGRADSLFGAVQDAEDAGDNVELDPREMRVPPGDVFAVYDRGGRRLGGSAGAPESLVRMQGGRELRTEHAHRHSYRVLRRDNLRIIDRAESGGVGLERPVTIVYATPLDHLWHEVFTGIGFYLAASAVLIAGTTVFMVGLMRRVLQPIEELAAAAAAVSPRRLQFEASPLTLETRELRPLATTLDAMVGELREAFERQHRFLGDAAHELKTAVAVVRSSLQVMLLRRRSPAEYEAGLRAAVRDNARAEELISRMLLMAALEQPASQGAARSELGSVVRGCVAKLQPLAEQAGVLLERNDGARGWVEVSVSAENLEVLLSNLLVNAVEHSERGASVEVVWEAVGREAAVRVVDHGQGIPAEALPHIFERFYRADRSRARVTGGAGLGLSIAQAIAEGAGGSIAAESRLGEGTVMCVRLPVIAMEAAGRGAGEGAGAGVEMVTDQAR